MVKPQLPGPEKKQRQQQRKAAAQQQQNVPHRLKASPQQRADAIKNGGKAEAHRAHNQKADALELGFKKRRHGLGKETLPEAPLALVLGSGLVQYAVHLALHVQLPLLQEKL